MIRHIKYLILLISSYIFIQCEEDEAKSAILGTWQCDQLIWESCDDANMDKNETCHSNKYIFNEDGTWLFESSVGTSEGVYVFSDSLLSLTIHDQSSEDIAISFSGNTMTTVYTNQVTGCEERNLLIRQ